MILRLTLTLALVSSLSFAQSSEQTEFFEKKIRPVFVKSCQACHNEKVKTAALDLSTAAGFAQGGQSGVLVSREKPEQSRLLQVISYDERLKMPPTGKLTAEELSDITAWVKMGAPWPGAAPVVAAAPTKERQWSAEQKSFWAFQPIQKQTPPAVRNTAWVLSPIDRFIMAKLEEKGLAPAEPASKLTLLRRATFDLTGLPPTEQEIRDFAADTSPQAFAKVVDRLLASPRYGERWGRNWLDVARYADSTGNDEDHRYPYAWRYRDYVIDAFNSDLPFHQFVREQIAGDLLPAPQGMNARGIVATGFLALGPKAIAQQDKKKMLYDVYDEQVDVTTRAFLGLTVSCARCHDHKFDPIYTKDYYSLVSIFASTKSFKDSEAHVSKMLFRPLVAENEYERYQKYQDTLGRNKMAAEDVVDEEREKYSKLMSPRLGDYMLAARKVYQDGAALADVAREANLQEPVLGKWVKYLTPAKGSLRPHLTAWEQASPADAAAVSQTYQTDFQARLTKWNKTLSTWRKTARKRLAEMNMPPPDKPTFD
ncbi:MAG: DUF1549 domain-containing protein, partial [Bryobacteraceae bacterium]